MRRHALRHGDLKLLRWLVAAGADVLAANGDGEGELGLQADPLLRLVWDDLMEEARCGSLPAVVLPALGSLCAGGGGARCCEYGSGRQAGEAAVLLWHVAAAVKH